MVNWSIAINYLLMVINGYLVGGWALPLWKKIMTLEEIYQSYYFLGGRGALWVVHNHQRQQSSHQTNATIKHMDLTSEWLIWVWLNMGYAARSCYINVETKDNIDKIEHLCVSNFTTNRYHLVVNSLSNL